MRRRRGWAPGPRCAHPASPGTSPVPPSLSTLRTATTTPSRRPPSQPPSPQERIASSWYLLAFCRLPNHQYCGFELEIEAAWTTASASGQDDPEQAAAAFLALDLDAPAVRLHRPARDGEAEPHSTGAPRPGAIEPVEAVEDASMVHLGDPRSTVLHLDGGLAGRQRPDGDADVSPGGRVLDGVIEEIHDALAEERRIALRLDEAIPLHLELLLLLLGEHAEVLRGARRERAEVHDRPRRLQTPGFGPGQGEEIFDEPGEPLDLLQHAADDVSIAGAVERIVQRHLAHAPHRGERGAELVRGIGGEAVKPLERVLQPPQRLVEDGGEAAEFVAGVLDREPLAQGFGGDPPRPLRHGSDRRQDATGEQEAAPDRQCDRARDAECEHQRKRRHRPAELALVRRHRDAMGRERHAVDPERLAVPRRPREDRGPRSSVQRGVQPLARPRLGPVQDPVRLEDLEELDTCAGICFRNFARVLAVGPLDGGDVAVQARIELLQQPCADQEEDGRRERADDQGEHRRVPERETRTNASRPQRHRGKGPSKNPTPRMVWISFVGKGSSTLRRTRAMVTSMTLSSGVARAVTCQTSRASISRETTVRCRRRRYSRISNSLAVRSSASAPRAAVRATRSITRSSCSSFSTWSMRPRRSRARMRASSSANANGFTR